MNPLTWAFDSVSKRGLVQTIKVAVSVVLDVGFDLRYGTETMSWIQLNALHFEAENKSHATLYKPTRAQPLRRLIDLLQLPKDVGFVDFGSGKGRVLLIAAQCGFGRIVGIEFSPELCDVARANIEAFRRRTGISARIDIVKSDVVNYAISSDQSVFFMFRPFDAVVTGRVLESLQQSVRRFPRQVWLIYNDPKDPETIGRSGLFHHSRRYEIGGTEFMVYHNSTGRVFLTGNWRSTDSRPAPASASRVAVSH